MTPALMFGVGAVVVAGLVVLTLALAARRERRSRLHVEQQLAGSRHEMDQLVQQVEQLAGEVAHSRRRAAEGHEYVITTLTEAAQVTGRPAGPGTLGTARSTPDAVVSVARAVEEQAVARLATLDTGTRLGALLTGAGVKAVAVGHGLRRALTQENLDRASAEAHVARRRSRRTRRQELREARRLLRAVRAQQLERTAAGRAGDSEDAA